MVVKKHQQEIDQFETTCKKELANPEECDFVKNMHIEKAKKECRQVFLCAKQPRA